VSLVSTTRRAKIAVLVIVLCGFSLGSYPLWTIGVEKGSRGLLKCLIKDRHGPTGAAYKQWNTAVLMFGTLVIPGVIIAAITSVIVAFLMRAARRRESLQMDRQVAYGSNVATDMYYYLLDTVLSIRVLYSSCRHR